MPHRRVLLFALAGAALVASPAAAGAQTRHVTSHTVVRSAGASVQGTAVHLQARRHAWIVAGRNGTLHLVRTAARLHPGARVTVHGAALPDHTIQARSLTRAGTRHVVRVRGVVVARTARTLTIAANGATLSIRRHLRHGARTLASDSGPSGPAVGTAVTTTVKVDDQGDVEQDGNVQDDGDNHGDSSANAELSGAVLSVTAGAGGASTVLITLGDSNTQVALTAPSGLDLTGLTTGAVADFKVNIAADPSTGQNVITIVRFESDDSNDNNQGDDDQGDSNDQGGGGGD